MDEPLSAASAESENKGDKMKRTVAILSLLSLALLSGAVGCSTLHNSDATALQGTWNGREIGASPETPRQLMISGQHIEYHGANPDDWGKGTYTLREDTQPKQLLIVLTECGSPKYIGKTACVIYKIEGNTLTAAANEPGDPAAPSSFDASGARQMVFQKQ